MFQSLPKGKALFCIDPGKVARSVCLAGDFNNWVPLVLQKGMDGKFAAAVPLHPGTYEYKFIVDGKWITDPDNQIQAANAFGTSNSIAQISSRTNF